MSKKVSFKAAVEDAEHLQLCKGLQAISTGEGKGLISCAKNLKGSVNIDLDCKAADPNGCRWDYLVGVGNKGSKVVAHYIEVHSANTKNIKEVRKKLEWLKQYLQNQSKLKSLEAKFHWVASGSIKIPKHTSHFKKLATMGLAENKPVRYLDLCPCSAELLSTAR